MSEFNVSADTKRALLEQRIEALNLEGYQHELLLKQFEAAGAGDSAEAQASRDAITAIKAALSVCAAELEEGNI
jgi:hypothetical protein